MRAAARPRTGHHGASVDRHRDSAREQRIEGEEGGGFRYLAIGEGENPDMRSTTDPPL
jgi:hypothetical protein